MINEFDYRQRRELDGKRRVGDLRTMLLTTVAVLTVLIQAAELYLITHHQQAQTVASLVGKVWPWRT